MHDMVDLEHTEFERHVFAEDIESAKKEVIKKDILEVVVEEKHAHSPSHIFDDEKSRSIEKSVNGYEIQKGENNVFLKLWKVKYGLRHISDPIDKKEEYENYIVAFTDYDAKDLIEKVNQKKGIIDEHIFFNCEKIDVEDIGFKTIPDCVVKEPWM